MYKILPFARRLILSTIVALGAVLWGLRTRFGARHDISTFFWNFISNPISLVLSVALLTILVSQTPLRRWRPWTRNRGI